MADLALPAAVAAARPLDRLRSHALRRMGWTRRFVVDREARVLAGGLAAVGLAAIAALVAPIWLMALGPLLLGVPHLLSDARYLVARPGLHRDAGWRWLVAAPLLAMVVVAHPAVGATAVVGAAVWARRPLALVCAVVLLAVALRWPWGFALGLAHAHNAVAIVLWWRLRPRPRAHLLVPAAWVAFVVLVGSGALDPWVSAGALRSGPIGVDAFAATLAPGWVGVDAFRVLVLFAFAQSVHYSVWLRLVPDDARERATPRTFVASVRALQADVGGWVFGAFVVATVAVAVSAVFAVTQAHAAYLRLAIFHGYLELCALLVPAHLLRSPPFASPRDSW